MLPKMNKMYPNVHKSSSNCPLMIVASIHSMVFLQSRNNLHKEKSKVRTNVLNEGKRVKMNDNQLQILLERRTRQTIVKQTRIN